MSSATPPLITVIIPTLADSARSRTLLRAICSVTSQGEVRSTVLVVVNGQRYDPLLLSELEARTDITILKLPAPSLVAARHCGRTAVETPFFSFLDDDDEYLPNSLANRVSQMQLRQDCVMAISGGYREIAGQRTVSAANLPRIQADPYREMATNNWMTSCGATFRSSLVPDNIFADIPSFHEWTYLAYKLLGLGPFCTVTEPCYVIHDTPNSLSKSSAYSEAYATVLRSILELPLPPDAVHSVRERLAKAEHNLASAALELGRRKTAWRHHFRSLRLPGGLRYLAFTRRLF